MKNNVISKFICSFLVIVFSFLIIAPITEAKPHNDESVKFEHHQKKSHRRVCSDIIIDVLKCSRYDFERARQNTMTLEDYIIAVYIAEQIKEYDFEDIYKMNKNGKPYKEICKDYGLNWGSVRRHMNHDYEVMSEDAARIGLIMWGLHDILK